MGSEKTIAVIDDDLNIRELIKLYLEKAGYQAFVYKDGREFLAAFKDKSFHLLILDLMLPDLDGYDILREVRKNSNVPVIMVTAKGDTFDKVLGLELGSDDYIVKPFDPKELMARIKAVIRRYSDNDEEKNIFILKDLKVDQINYVVKYKDEVIEMPPKEFELLTFLVNNPNRVFTREQLLEKIWGYDYVGESRTVDVHIKRVREKLDNNTEGWEIKTVWGVGYKFRADL